MEIIVSAKISFIVMIVMFIIAVDDVIESIRVRQQCNMRKRRRQIKGYDTIFFMLGPSINYFMNEISFLSRYFVSNLSTILTFSLQLYCATGIYYDF